MDGWIREMAALAQPPSDGLVRTAHRLGNVICQARSRESGTYSLGRQYLHESKMTLEDNSPRRGCLRVAIRLHDFKTDQIIYNLSLITLELKT